MKIPPRHNGNLCPLKKSDTSVPLQEFLLCLTDSFFSECQECSSSELWGQWTDRWEQVKYERMIKTTESWRIVSFLWERFESNLAHHPFTTLNCSKARIILAEIKAGEYEAKCAFYHGCVICACYCYSTWTQARSCIQIPKLGTLWSPDSQLSSAGRAALKARPQRECLSPIKSK